MVNFSLFFLLCYIAFCDITKRRIYNVAIIVLFIASLIILFFGENSWSENNFKFSLISFFVFLVFFLLFYKIGWMGAGDVKLGGVLALLFGFYNFLWVWGLSIFLSLFYVGMVKVMYSCGQEVVRLKLTANDIGKKYIPYGAILSIASMLMILKVEAGL